MSRLMSAKRLRMLAIAALAFLVPPAGGSFAAEDAKFAFVVPSSLNLLYSVNRQTGEVGACEYQPAEDKAQVGGTKCFPRGEGAGPQGSGRYDLKALPASKSGAVFRFNADSGDISICWVRDGKVVCTAPGQ